MYARKIAAMFDQSRENVSQHETIEKHEKVFLKANKVDVIFSLEINTTFYKKKLETQPDVWLTI